MLFSYHEQPGLRWTKDRTTILVDQLRDVATDAFGLSTPSLLPNYQCLVYDGLDDKIIVVATDCTGRMLGFLSCVILPIPTLQNPVIHLGLMCVRPEALCHGLTQRLTRQFLQGYITSHIDVLLGIRKIWFTNCACVCRTLGAIARSLDTVYPSPQYPPSNGPPTRTHALIAESIAASDALREAMYVPSSAEYDGKNSVFRGSAQTTIFMKNKDDARYHHRDRTMTDFYQALMDWQRGDEVLQVGQLGIWALVR